MLVVNFIYNSVLFFKLALRQSFAICCVTNYIPYQTHDIADGWRWVSVHHNPHNLMLKYDLFFWIDMDKIPIL